MIAILILISVWFVGAIIINKIKRPVRPSSGVDEIKIDWSCPTFPISWSQIYWLLSDISFNHEKLSFCVRWPCKFNHLTIFYFYRSWEVGVFPSRIASRERNHWRTVGLALPNSKNHPWLFITLLMETLKLRPRPLRYQTKQNCPAWLTLQVKTYYLPFQLSMYSRN